ncbi:geranylgeranyl transferase type-2 subunit alpha 1 isoform X2 [Pyrus x bretschneideri]|uniref:geranylgeranyl transferase type-2 subunit alpha 1 isoform X2 n=1 Tax=Pyrus x bretschneideri TaxID=225117 RepID=UPI00203029FC|nr:geranylgeranyl transferase type-2 subunit alpha 1 isoform X2 [Pyrus x bretschneideri]
MHGRPRKPAKPEDESASAARAEALRALQSQFFSNHHNKVYTDEALQLSGRLIEQNPEFYTAWNYRKLVVQQNLDRCSESEPDALKSIIDQELRLVEIALRQNFKSYGAWHHRKWVLSKGHSVLDREMKLLKQFQQLDPRNFHAWNYRRFVAALLNRSDEEELEYTREMVENNFSNYSAWHNRSVLLSNLMKKKAEGFFPKVKVLNNEYEHVHDAIFTDPDDQSGWFYYTWLLDQTVKTDAPLLVSSWPAHGSSIILSRNRLSSDCSSSPFDSFHSDSGTVPLLIYFNQAVEGVNSSSITIESSFCTKDLIWKPVLQNNSQLSQVWATHIKFPNAKSHSSEAYQLKVSVGQTQGIISASGFDYNHPTQFAFKVCVRPIETEPAEKQGEDIILWTDENFHGFQTQSQELHEVVPVDQQSINDVHEPTASNWRAETIAKEIALFRELVSEINCKIGKLTLARLLTAHDVILSPYTNKMFHYDEVLQLYTDLIKLDPSHSQYYKDEHSLVFLQKVTSNRKSLLRHCFSHKNLASSSIGNHICLRLNNLSLSRMGSVEKLLWVRMLDLSHNELHSIEV